ncbi:MAG: hypothetical protein ACI84R_000757 [Candidatus Azotimanducaceae bacterium]|jgi:hypothetical protein
MNIENLTAQKESSTLEVFTCYTVSSFDNKQLQPKRFFTSCIQAGTPVPSLDLRLGGQVGAKTKAKFRILVKWS